ncbi:MAG: type I DNA topoisomerase [Acidobacteria bacterium]|nr:type I DNA topoisomerase [Acidobacteriota bacterium]
MPKASKQKTEKPARAAKAVKAARGTGKALVVVESPAKAKTINRYLGEGYLVKYSLGHIKDLPKKGLGVEVEKNFRPTYEPIPTKKALIAELKQAANLASVIYLAADPDREGEAICQHLAEELSNGKPIHRVLFNEITKQAIQEAFQRPGEINEKLVEAQQARRILDRLEGYKISPLLWDKVRMGLSAGRVQTVALRIIVEREREIRAFEREEFWTVAANLGAAGSTNFEARLVRRNGTELITKGEGYSGSIRAQAEKGKIYLANQSQANEICDLLRKENFVVASNETKEVKRNPMPPFITSTLQQEAVRKLRFAPKYAMGLAQRLYEGVEIGEEDTVGLITYMRTDSTRVSDAALGEVRARIRDSYGEKYLPNDANSYRSKKGAQDAHEAIRPTSVRRSPDAMSKYLSEDEAKLYRLIWQRFVASQMTPALFDQTTIEITAGDFGLRATGSVLKFDGFLKVYQESKDQKDEEDDEFGKRLPMVKAGERLELRRRDEPDPVAAQPVRGEQHFTEPPARYNLATLVKELERKGIGRPSTYATILSTIQEREYVHRAKGGFSPTQLGEIVTDLLVENFSDIFDVMYTAKLEESLDDIEDGKQEWVETLDEFYQKFKKDLKHAERHMVDVKRMEQPTEYSCEKCGKQMVIKFGRNGKFLACSGYPDCTNTRELPPELSERSAPEEGASPEAEQTCENCGRPMVLKRGRFGQFLACSGYPECKTTRKIGETEKKPSVPTGEKCPECSSELVIRQGRYGEFTSCSTYPKCKYIKQDTTGVACPECKQGEIVQKRSKRGKAFFSCNRYPKCKFSLWNKPISQSCPKCSSVYLVEKTTKSGTTLECPNESCDFKEAA